jgi:hypothetical protein
VCGGSWTIEKTNGVDVLEHVGESGRETREGKELVALPLQGLFRRGESLGSDFVTARFFQERLHDDVLLGVAQFATKVAYASPCRARTKSCRGSG